MLIRFKKPDPRAGAEAHLDSSLAQQFVDEGRAELVKSPEKKAEPVAENKAVQAAPENKMRPEPKNKAKG